MRRPVYQPILELTRVCNATTPSFTSTLTTKPIKDNSNRTSINGTPLAPISMCALNQCMFSVGALKKGNFAVLINMLRQRNIPMITMHANYLKAKEMKVQGLRNNKLWLATLRPKRNVVECAPYTPWI